MIGCLFRGIASVATLLLAVSMGRLVFIQLTGWVRCMLPIVHLFTGNGLKDLSTGIGALSSLRTLRVSGNALATLPAETASLPLLKEVHVGGNAGLDREGVKEMLRQRPDIAIVWDDNGEKADNMEADTSVR